MDTCDVLIVGGGPAGSSCAWALRGSGRRVMVLDKAAFPRNKICGGWITPPVLQALNIDPQEYARGRTLQPITGFRVSCLKRREVELDYDRSVSYGIRRSEFDDFLLRRSGAEIRDGQKLATLERSDHSWIVNGEIKTRLLVGAGGHFCPVARSLSARNGEQAVVAQESEFLMDEQQAASCSIQPEVPELFFCSDLLGYGWCFRKGNFLNIGLGRLDQHSLRDHVSRFIQFLRDSGKIGFDPPQPCGHAYLLAGYSQRRLLDDSVLLIGDAAGLAYAQSGEGIWPAVKSGLLAAQVIRDAKDYSRSQLAMYEALLEQTFTGDASPAENMARHLPRGLRNAIGRWLLSKEWFCRRQVIDNWFLHARDSGIVN